MKPLHSYLRPALSPTKPLSIATAAGRPGAANSAPESVDKVLLNSTQQLSREEQLAAKKIDTYLARISGSLERHSLKNIENVDPPRWKHEIGYHCDFTSTTRFELDGKTYHFSVSGYQNHPDETSYDLEEIKGPHPEVENHFITGESLSSYRDFLKYDVSSKERYILTNQPGHAGFQTDSEAAKSAKSGRIEDARRLSTRIKELLGDKIVRVTEGYRRHVGGSWGG